MRLDKLKEVEVEKRRGSTGRTIVQFIWLLIAIGISYAFTQFLFNEGHLTANQLYNQLFIPRSVPVWVLKGGIIFVMVVVIQFFLFLGFAIANPRGRVRSGYASPYSDSPDPFDDHRG
jgi:hypothetical protein